MNFKYYLQKNIFIFEFIYLFILTQFYFNIFLFAQVQNGNK